MADSTLAGLLALATGLLGPATTALERGRAAPARRRSRRPGPSEGGTAMPKRRRAAGEHDAGHVTP